MPILPQLYHQLYVGEFHIHISIFHFSSKIQISSLTPHWIFSHGWPAESKFMFKNKSLRRHYKRHTDKRAEVHGQWIFNIVLAFISHQFVSTVYTAFSKNWLLTCIFADISLFLFRGNFQAFHSNLCIFIELGYFLHLYLIERF